MTKKKNKIKYYIFICCSSLAGNPTRSKVYNLFLERKSQGKFYGNLQQWGTTSESRKR